HTGRGWGHGAARRRLDAIVRFRTQRRRGLTGAVEGAVVHGGTRQVSVAEAVVAHVVEGVVLPIAVPILPGLVRVVDAVAVTVEVEQVGQAVPIVVADTFDTVAHAVAVAI